MIDAEAGQHAQDGVGVAVLRAGFHQRFRSRCPARIRLPTFAKATVGRFHALLGEQTRETGPGQAYKSTAIHGILAARL